MIHTLYLMSGAFYNYHMYHGNRTRFVAAARAERARRQATAESEVFDSLLRTTMHDNVLTRMSQNENVYDTTLSATVLFSDLAGFTEWSSDKSAVEVVTMLNTLVFSFDALAMAHPGVEKVKTIGDAYWAMSGLPLRVGNHASALCRFAVAMQGAIRACNSDHREWGGINMRVGVHSGPASAAVLGTQRLSYEPFGLTCTLAEEAEKACAPGRVAVTQTTLNFLKLEADRQTMDLDYDVTADPYFGSSNDVESQAQHLITLDPSQEKIYLLPALKRLSEQPATRRTKDVFADSLSDVLSVLSQATEHRSLAAVSVDGGMRQRLIDERMAFIMKRAKEHAASLREQSRDANADMSGSGMLDGGGGNFEASLESAPRLDLSLITVDADTGPYSRATQFPFLYWFADSVAEQGYLDFIQTMTHSLRLGLRVLSCATSLGLLSCLLVERGAEAPPAGASCFALAALVSLTNAGAIQFRLPNVVDLVLPYVWLLVLFVGMLLSGNSMVGNDTTYLSMFAIYTSLSTPAWSPLMRGSLFCLFGVSSVAKIIILNVGSTQRNGLQMFTGIPVTLLLSASLDVFSRRSFVEQRLADALAERKEEAKRAQATMLESIVPRHTIPLLREWLRQDFDPSKSIVKEFPLVAVCFLKLVRHKPCEFPHPFPLPSHPDVSLGQRENFGWLIDGHKRLDTLLDQCTTVDKIKTIGPIALLAGPFYDDGATLPEGVEHATNVAKAMTEMMMVARRAADAGLAVVGGVHVGPVVGAVLGTQRLCFDIFGDTVNTASRVYSNLPRNLGTGAGLRELQVGFTEPAVRTLGCLSESGPATSSTCPEHARVTFAPHPILVHAKGKGEIGVHLVEAVTLPW
jgi:class 3 adenylate cyclase